MPGKMKIKSVIPTVSNLIPICLIDEIRKHPDFHKSKKCACPDTPGKCEDRSCRNVDHMVECGRNCGKFCLNQRLRKGIVTGPIITVNVDSEIGTAVKAIKFIKKGTALCEYFGTLKRTLQYEREHRLDSERKIFAMEHVEGFVLDATEHDQVGRNINHSCKGNCKPIPYFVDDFPRILIVATRDILKDEFVTYNYNLQAFKGMQRFICRCKKEDCIDRSVLLLEKLVVKEFAERSFQCDLCGKAFYTRQTLFSHKKRHTAEKSYMCGSCDKSYISAYELKRHEITHTMKVFKTYLCPLCPKKYSKKFYRDRHVEQHVDSKLNLFKCSRCDTTFYFDKELKDHVKAGSPRCIKRRMINLYHCHLCNFKCGWKLELQKHLRYTHRNFRPYKCTECDYAYQTASGLDAHKLIAHGEPKYKCTDCDKQFHFNHKLKRHQEIHASKRKKIRCPVIDSAFRACGKKYAYKNLLINHINICH